MPPSDHQSNDELTDATLARYSRQILFPPIGPAGQRRLVLSRVALLGCGALGSVLANTMVRAGVGYLRIIDRDFIELDNLQRQVLFDETDIANNLPKAEAAARRLRQINSTVTVEPLVVDFNTTNAETCLGDVQLILDGTDNLETRYLLNDVAIKSGIPWIHGACLGAEGRVMPILPGKTPCLRCIWPTAPPPGSLPTCDTAGVIAPIVNIVASLQAVAALKLLSGHLEDLECNLTVIDAWSGRVHQIDVQNAYQQGDCPCCHHGQYDFLTGDQTSTTVTLCGRDAVQILPSPGHQVNFQEIVRRLDPATRPIFNEFLLRFSVEDFHITLFPDGRAIIKGTSDPTTARTTYARYIGL
ncbi:MAG: ThiF family adenylyltransferase [Planctomycetota bacterium]